MDAERSVLRTKLVTPHGAEDGDKLTSSVPTRTRKNPHRQRNENFYAF